VSDGTLIIAHLANASFSTGLFPRSMKFAIVTPLLKKAGLDTSVKKNFRPVSNLSSVYSIKTARVAGDRQTETTHLFIIQLEQSTISL